MDMSIKRSPRLAALFIVLVAFALSACYQRWVSVGHMPSDSRWRTEQRVAHSKFEGTELKLDVSASNVSGQRDSGIDDFAISLRFYPKEAGIRFDPRQVRLVVQGSEETAPRWARMIPSVVGWESAWQCGYGINAVEATHAFPLNRDICFEFYFPVRPPSPDTAFTLRVQGLTRDGGSIGIPDIHFKKGSFWVWDFLGR